MPDLETMHEIAARWRREGVPHTPRDVTAEWERQGLVHRRNRESEILAAADRLTDTNQSLEARHLREVAQQIHDHRGAGNWTTGGYPPRRNPALPPVDPDDERIATERRRDRLDWYAREGVPA